MLIFYDIKNSLCRFMQGGGSDDSRFQIIDSTINYFNLRSSVRGVVDQLSLLHHLAAVSKGGQLFPRRIRFCGGGEINH